VSKHLLPAKEIRAMFGGVSDMTLWRWLQDESLGFPQPTVIRSRRYWDADEIEEFRNRMVGAGIAKRAA
jgi:predicted DNA-binding transcriptional regulator AlpA